MERVQLGLEEYDAEVVIRLVMRDGRVKEFRVNLSPLFVLQLHKMVRS